MQSSTQHTLSKTSHERIWKHNNNYRRKLSLKSRITLIRPRVSDLGNKIRCQIWLTTVQMGHWRARQIRVEWQAQQIHMHNSLSMNIAKLTWWIQQPFRLLRTVRHSHSIQWVEYMRILKSLTVCSTSRAPNPTRRAGRTRSGPPKDRTSWPTHTPRARMVRQWLHHPKTSWYQVLSLRLLPSMRPPSRRRTASLYRTTSFRTSTSRSYPRSSIIPTLHNPLN